MSHLSNPNLARRKIAPISQIASLPHRIDVGARFITVDHVIEGDVNGPNALDWKREAVASVGNQQLAEEAAIAWFDETDQCARCEVMFRIVDGRGNQEFILVEVRPEVVARAKRRQIIGGAA